LEDYAQFEAASASEILTWAVSRFGDRFAIATSFQKEGMVILDLAARLADPVRVFTLDTGRLPEETYRMMETVRGRYGITVETVFPEAADVEQMVSIHGPNLFYDSLENRTLCCEIRKVRPLERKLKTLDAWATGMRREHSESRAQIAKVELVNGRTRISPLADWAAAEIAQYIEANDVPVHPLYRCGYASIGCAPCTRAIGAGEEERAGRWWWEQDGRKECGIHFSPDGVVKRSA